VTHTKSCTLCCADGAVRVLASSVVLGTWAVVVVFIDVDTLYSAESATAFGLAPAVLSAKQRARRQPCGEGYGWPPHSEVEE